MPDTTAIITLYGPFVQQSTFRENIHTQLPTTHPVTAYNISIA